MKLTIAEATTFLSKQFGTDVEIEIPTTETESDDWIVNTKTGSGHPSSLSEDSDVEVMFNDGSTDSCYCGDWIPGWWNVDRPFHIVKYRVMK